MAKRTLSVVFADEFSEMTPAELTAIVQQGEQIAKLAAGAKAYIDTQLRTGNAVPGWKLAAGKRSREWVDEETAKKALAEQGINDPYERPDPVFLSVAKAEKKPGVDATKLADAWKWVPGNQTLTFDPMGAAAVPIATTPNYGF